MDCTEIKLVLKTYFDSLYMSQWGVSVRLQLILKDYFDMFYAALSPKVKFTPEGGVAVKLINNTGGASIKGTVVTTSATIDNGFIIQSFEYEAAGIVYENGIADGDECWVVCNGIAEVLLKNGTSATRGNWVKAADIDGRAEATTPPSGIGASAANEHFKEIGHCLETQSSGTDVLCKVLLYFN